MTQTTTFHSDQFRRARKIKVGVTAKKKVSPLAVAALAGNALAVVPGVPLAMAALGWKARRGIRRSAMTRRGTPIAWAAVVLGLGLTAAQGVAGFAAWRHLDAARGGAALALDRGLSGDVEAFVDAFVVEGTRVEREIAAQVFLAEAELRYGPLASVRPDPAGVWSPDNFRRLLVDRVQHYTLNFERAAVRTHVALGGGLLGPRLKSVELRDPAHGSLDFPGTAQVAGHPGL